MRTYTPFAADGLDRTIVSMNAAKFVSSCSAANETLPIGACTLPRLVDAELDLARLDLLDGLRHVHRDGARLRVRHQAARTEHPAELRRAGPSESGVATITSKSSQPSLIFCEVLECRRNRRPPPRRPSPGRPAAMTSTRTVLPVPCGQHDRAAHHLVGVARIDAETDGDVDRLVELREARRLHQLERPSAIV